MLIPGIVAHKSVAAAYTAEAVTFDGTNDQLTLTGGGLSTADTKSVTFSYWYRETSHTLNEIIVNINTNNNMATGNVVRNSGNISGDVVVIMRNAANTIILNHDSGTTDPVINLNEWNHVMGSYDLLNGVGTMCVNGFVVGNAIATITNDTIDHTRTLSYIGGRTNTGTTGWINGDVAEIYYSNEFIDLSIEANRRKFYTATGTPEDLGSDGSTPTGTAPMIYFKGDASVWNAGTNSGSGGNFTMAGSVVDSANEPVELVTQAVFFDGANDYTSKASDLTGAADGTDGTLSFWARFPTGEDIGYFVWDAVNASNFRVFSFQMIRDGHATIPGVLSWSLRQPNNTVVCSGNTTTNYIDAAWHHFLVSWNSTTVKCYVDDVSDISIGTSPTGSNIDWTPGSWTFGATDNTQAAKIHADVAEFWLTNEYLNLDTESNRRKFISGAGAGAKPVFLGGDGSIPTGTAPLVYFKGSRSPWNAGINQGSGGDFTMTGAVTDSANEPVQV